MALDRIRKAADFELTLANRPRSRSAHFALHYAGMPHPQRTVVSAEALANELSTGLSPELLRSVDNNSVRLGCVIPKKHARRAVTRNLLRRAIRVAVEAAQPKLAPGLWVVRLKLPFDKRDYPSAASLALRRAVRAELAGLLGAAGRKGSGG